MLRPDIRHVWLDGRYTSLTMEREFWEQFRLITIERRVTVGELLRVIERTGRLQPYRGQSHVLTLSAAVRVFVLRTVMEKLAIAETRLAQRSKLCNAKTDSAAPLRPPSRGASSSPSS
jgi:predicted DNA-binding ribbon-helix-helix protein